MLNQSTTRRFWVLAITTVAIIYALILVGGVVRATGSGMGCPDWPTCFGQWIPPTHESQLPADYQTTYAALGYAETTFNVRKTWTEYVNRLLGVFTGFAILLTLLFSLPFRKHNKPVVYLALAGFILVGVQGWLGSRVVASNLHPGLITIHMLLAQLIVALMIAAVVRSANSAFVSSSIDQFSGLFFTLMKVAMGIGLVQLVIGTQVREAVDLVAKQSNYVNRHLWIDNLPLIFNVHKYFAIPVFLLNAWLIVQVHQHAKIPAMRILNSLLGALLVATVVLGMSMDRLHLPVFAQPLHLWFASLIFGVQLSMMLILQEVRRGDQVAA